MADPLAFVRRSHLIELAQAMIALPSVTGEEGAMADWVEAYLRFLGLREVRRLTVPEVGDTVVGWTDGPAGGPTLLLNFHLDTFPVCEGWRTDPFTPHLHEGRLYGLGAHDMKGGAACLLGAVEAILASGIELGGRLMVAATSDEENWSRGAHALIAAGLVEGCIGCLIPEPSAAGTLTIGARGRHLFHLTFHGRAAHSAYEEGVNALVDAARVVVRLAQPGALPLAADPRFDIAETACVVGFQSGGQLVLVPDRADVFIDRFTLPGQTVEELADQLHRLVTDVEIDGLYTLRWDERPTPAPGPYLVSPESRLVRTVQSHLAAESGRSVRLVLARSVADTNHFAVYGGVPTLICGPQGGNTCAANEYLLVESLPIVARTYVRSVLDLLGMPDEPC